MNRQHLSFSNWTIQIQNFEFNYITRVPWFYYLIICTSQFSTNPWINLKTRNPTSFILSLVISVISVYFFIQDFNTEIALLYLPLCESFESLIKTYISILYLLFTLYFIPIEWKFQFISIYISVVRRSVLKCNQFKKKRLKIYINGIYWR